MWWGCVVFFVSRYEMSELVSMHWYRPEIKKEIENYQKQYEAVNVLSQPLRSDNNAKN